MVRIVIKKRVSLDFLGEEYKDSYIEFGALAISEYEKYRNEVEKPDAKNLLIMLKVLKDLFIEGSFKGEALAAEDLDQIDVETAITCFNEVTGNSPKALGQSTNSLNPSDQTE